MKFNRKGLDDTLLLELYRQLLMPRFIEEKMLIALRQGRISKWFSGYGQEAISVGVGMAMDPEEYILPMHRNLGIFTSRGIDLYRLFAQFQGKADGFTKGRDRSFHFGSTDHHLVGMISHLGPQMGIADGIALASRLSEEKRSTLVITGDGGASQGDFHESVNVASVWDLPVIFLIENNRWGLSTPSSEQFNFESFVYKSIGYGIKAKSVDGNNVLAVYNAIQEINQEIRNDPQPYILECKTFRMRGHEEASGTKYYPEGLIEKWEKKDPVDNYRVFLMESNILDPELNEKMTVEIKKEISDAFERAYSAPTISFNRETELADVFAPHSQPVSPPTGPKREMRLVDAIHEGLGQAMEKHDKLIIMGQDIADYGGVFKVTEGLSARFGKQRVRNTPLCESAIVGTAIGLSIKGYKAIMEMQFADFVTEGFNQIINNAAKLHWRWGQKVDMVIRMPTGAGVAAGPFHSQSNEAWFTHTAGLKVLYPAFPEDAKGLLLAAIEDPNPVMFFEHKALYRSVRGEVPEEWYELPIGKARRVREGSDLSIITYGMGVHWALAYMDEHPDLSIDLIDLRSLAPLDSEMIFDSSRKTGRVIVLQEDVMFGGIASDISAQIMEHCFESLDAPVRRVASLNTPIPFAQDLEKGYLAQSRLAETIEELLNY